MILSRQFLVVGAIVLWTSLAWAVELLPVGKLPFASVSTPAHIVKMHEAGTNRAQVESGRAQSQATKRISAG